jgi:acyl-CoA dehydrogenase
MTAYASVWESPERKALRDSVTALTQKEIVPHLPQWEEDGQLPRELHAITAKAGFLGLGFPEEVGGSGGDMVDVTVATEAMLEAGGSGGVQASLFTHGIALPHIVENGSADLIDRYVRPTLAGEKIGALGITEPGTGSDVANIRTRAVRDGDDYVINGAKMFITSGVRADFVTTVVRTGEDGHGGLSLIVVDKGTPGFTVSKSLKKNALFFMIGPPSTAPYWSRSNAGLMPLAGRNAPVALSSVRRANSQAEPRKVFVPLA